MILAALVILTLSSIELDSVKRDVLDKGYSILYKDGKIIKNTKDIVLDDNLNVIISDGNIDVIVKGVNK